MMLEIERTIMKEALINEKDLLIKARSVTEIGTVAREQLEQKIDVTCKLLSEL